MPKEFGSSDDLRSARFTGVDLSGAQFRNVNLAGVKMVDAILANAELSGLIDGLTVNGIEVAPLIAEELARRHPERAELFVSEPEGLHRAWSLIEERAAKTVERARRLPEERLYQRVDDEWSFVETLRHLIFVTDAWIGRVVLGQANPYHRLGLPPTFVGDGTQIGIVPDAQPSFHEVLDVRQGRMLQVRDVVERVMPDTLVRNCTPNPAPGYPPDTIHTVIGCLWTVIEEEWAHDQFANRDLHRLESGA